MNRIDDDEEVRRSTRRRHLRREVIEADERGDIYEEDPEDELERLLEDMEREREKLNLDILALRLLLRRHLDLEARWRQFTSLGGFSVSDWRQFLDGELRPRLVRQRYHLRLISNRAKPAIRRLDRDPNAAA